MFVGMAAFAAVRFGLSGRVLPGLADPASLEFQIGMALVMATPMAAWMRVRSCGWSERGAMTAAMLLPTAALVVSSALALRDAQIWLDGNSTC